MAAKKKQKKFKVYYFTGDFYSSNGEERHVVTVEARDEAEAEFIFKNFVSQPNDSFGWVEPYRKPKE